MNGIERYTSVINQKRPDKIPLRVANYNMFFHYYYNLTINEYLENPEKHADCFIKFVREFEFDSAKPALGYIFYGCGPEMGTSWQFPQDEFPACHKGIIETPMDVDQIMIPAEPSGYFKKFLDINQMVKAGIGKETYLGISVIGPFTVMAFLRGYERLLLDMVQDLNFFNHMMKKGEKISNFIGKNIIDLGIAGTTMLEIFLVPGMVRPEFYDKYIEPYDHSVCKRLSTPPLPNTMGMFMGTPGESKRYQSGNDLYNYYFGTEESIDLICQVGEIRLPGFPKLISISGRALCNWSTENILSFVEKGLDFFVKKRGEYPSIFLTSVQPPNAESAMDVAHKIRAINKLREKYRL